MDSKIEAALRRFGRDDYGGGVYRRHILIDVGTENRVFAALEDEAHAFTLEIEHNGSCVTAINSQWNRFPTTMCQNAGDALPQIVGHRLSTNPLDLRSRARPVDHCTHFYDVAALTIHHAQRAIQEPSNSRHFLYRCAVSDSNNGEQQAKLTINDSEELHWQIKEGLIVSPARFYGQAVLKGLVSRVSGELSDTELQRVMVLQKAYFVSMARMLRTEDMAGEPCLETGQPIGTCYATRNGREREAIRTGKRIDYSENEEQLLRFFDR